MKTLWLAALSLLLLNSSSFADVVLQGSRPLTLQDCIEDVLEYNLQLRVARVGPVLAEHRLSLARSAYEPTLNLSGEHSYARTRGGFDEDARNIPASEQDRDSFGGNLGGLLPWGMRYGINANAADTYGVSARSIGTTNFFSPIDYSQGNIEARVEQPLLRNFWIDSTRLLVTVRKNELKRSREDLRNELIRLVTDVENAYYDLIAAGENVKVQQQGLVLARQLLEENRKRVQVGALAPLDEAQAESEVAAREADLVTAEQLLSARENYLRRLITDDYGLWHAARLVPTDKLIAVPQLFNLQDSWDKGLTMRPDYIAAQLYTEESGVRLKYTRNQLYPQLTAFAAYGYSGTDVEYSGMFSQWTDREYPYWSVGGNLSVPLGNAAARAQHREAQAEAERRVLVLKDLEQRIMAEIDNAIKVTRASYRKVDATRAARKYAEAALAAEQEKLTNGKSTSFEVLRLQRDLTQARSAEISALTEYNKALTALAQYEGSSLQRHRIDFEVP